MNGIECNIPMMKRIPGTSHFPVFVIHVSLKLNFLNLIYIYLQTKNRSSRWDNNVGTDVRGLKKKIDLVLITFYFAVSKLKSTAVSSFCFFRNWVLPYRSIFSISFSCYNIHTWCKNVVQKVADGRDRPQLT